MRFDIFKARAINSLTTKTAARRATVVVFALLATGCVSNSIQQTIGAYDAARGEISLGQSKQDVLSVLLPTQSALGGQFAKTPETYIEDGKTIEIYFMRSRSFNDGIVTDDEFTPYVFEDDALVAIGWTAIGGPKTQAQTRDDERDIHVHGRYFYWR